MGLDNGYKVVKVEEKKDGVVTAKYIYVETTTKKCKCSKCGKYTKSVHDKLKPVILKYVKAFVITTYVVVTKRRFICTEEVSIQRKKEYLLLQYIATIGIPHEFVISDMYEPYLVVTKIMFPKAKYSANQLHYIMHVTNMLVKV